VALCSNRNCKSGDAMLNYKRELSIMIGGFGCICLVRAAICAHCFNLLLSINGITNNDVIGELKNTQKLMINSFILFSIVALISIISAIGVFKNKVWAIKIWLFTTIPIFVYVLYGFFKYSSYWLQYLSTFVIILFSWYILWYLPRKQTEANS
jgi:hypothetical protein